MLVWLEAILKASFRITPNCDELTLKVCMRSLVYVHVCLCMCFSAWHQLTE